MRSLQCGGLGVLYCLSVLAPPPACAAAAPTDGSVLPFPPTPSASVAAPTLQDSKHQRRVETSHLPKDAPNILIILLDDVGFGLPDTYGGPIHTPTLTRIANQGISYNAFHTTSICSPTRAALLTGRNHQRVGSGTIAERAVGLGRLYRRDPAGRPRRSPRCSAHYGYKTAAFGKWHNTPATETTAMGPFTLWPTGEGIGFDYFYGFLAGETSQWEPRLFENFNPIEPPHDEKYHLSEDMADKAIAWMRKHRAFCARQAVPHVLGARRRARSAPHLQGVGRQVQRQVRRRLGRAARAHLQAPEGARLDSRGCQAHAARRDAWPRGTASRSRSVRSSGG